MFSRTITYKLLPLVFLTGTTAFSQVDSLPKMSKTMEKPIVLPDCPKPDPEKAFASLKLVRSDGSVYRTPREDWEGARQRTAADPEWNNWVTKQRTDLDAWMKHHHDRVEWQGGWWHDFVSPKDGAQLIWTDEIPGEQVKTIRSKTGDEVEVTPKIMGGWLCIFRGRHMDAMIDAARLFRLTDEAPYAEWAAQQLDFYAKNYQGWPINTSRNLARLGSQSLDDAAFLTRLVEVARLLGDWATPERRKMWFENLLKPEVELLDQTYQTIHNIALWHRAASAQVALLYKDEEMWKRVVDGEYGLRAQLQRGVTSDYFWYEQSMGYNAYVVKATLPLLLFAGLTGQKDKLLTEAAIVQNLMLSPLALRFPNDTLPNPADATGNIPKANIGTLAHAARVLPTALGLERAPSIRSWDTLVDPLPTSPTPAQLPEVTSRNLESTRFALLKKGAWQIFFHYGQINRSHSQSEALNWSASYQGVDITHDPGTLGYGSPITPGYFRRGLNHNVPLINGEGQKPWDPGKLLRFDADAGVMEAEQPDYIPGEASVRRTLSVSGDDLVDDVKVTTSNEAQLGIALHLQGTPRLPADFKEADLTKGRPEPFHYWKDVRSATYKDEAEIELVFPGNHVLKVRFSTPGEFTLYQGTSPDQPPKNRAAFYLEKSTPGKEAIFTTRLTPVP